MASIFDKVRLITLSNVHSLLDEVIDLNNIGAIEQHIRDLEEARNMLDDQAAASRSDAGVLPKEIGTLEAQHAAADSDITTLLNDGDSSNDHLAAPLEAKLIMLEKQIADKKAALKPIQDQVTQFDTAVSKINTAIIAAKGQLDTLRNLDTMAKGKERAAKALSGISLTNTLDVDGIATKLRRREAVADNKLSRALGGITEAVTDSGFDAEVAARLARRRQAQAAPATSTTPVAETVK